MKYGHKDFTGSPVEVADKRGKALANGLRLFARWHSIEFREPLTIDSNGEIALVVKHPNPTGPLDEACGQYGHAAAALIAKHNPRTGIAPSKFMSPENGWCRMNHFDVERLLTEFEKLRS